MPHFHATFSGGTVLTALLGAGLSWANVPILRTCRSSPSWSRWLACGPLRSCLPHEATAAGATAAHKATTGEKSASAWREPRTLLIGLVVLVAAFTEGTANDWLAVAFHEGHQLPTWAGVLAFATFLTCMTVGRIVGTSLLDKHGRVPVLRVCFTLAIIGSAMVIFGNAWLAFVGAAIWGVGASLGFPVGMSAAADDQARAAARMSVIATIGYAAFPPVLPPGLPGRPLGCAQVPHRRRGRRHPGAPHRPGDPRAATGGRPRGRARTAGRLSPRHTGRCAQGEHGPHPGVDRGAALGH